MLKRHSLEDLLEELISIEMRGGPRPEEFAALVDLFDGIAALRATPQHNEMIAKTKERLPSFCSRETMHGFVCLRPHGYAGDFEIIDRIYTHYYAKNSVFRTWDDFYHRGDAAMAVRGRKDYCSALFQRTALAVHHSAQILNVASGPARDVLEFKSLPGRAISETRVHCIDADANAIAYSRNLLAHYHDTVSFENRNAFRLRLKPEYDLIWSAGLFDYLDDKAFVRLLEKLGRALSPGGQLVVGNFAPTLRQRGFMEFGDWHLTYRDETQLRALARAAGFADDTITIGREATGVNLFLHISPARSNKPAGAGKQMDNQV